MSDHFESSKVRLTWADNRINDLERCIGNFRAEKPYTPIVENDSDGVHKIHKIKLKREFPTAITQFTVEAVQHLRSSLDHAAYTTAVLSGTLNPRDAYFPFCGKATDIDNILKGRCGDIPADIQMLFRSFKPYPCGNDLLWALNRVCNTQKHGFVIPTITQAARMEITKLVLHGSGTIAGTTPKWDSLKEEFVFARIDDSFSHFEYNLNFTFGIEFNEIEGVNGKPVVPTLQGMRAEVSRVVGEIETECHRIGLI
jgi:hypothetical protein